MSGSRRRTRPGLGLGLWLGLGTALACLTGCQGESRYDAFLRAQKLEGEAERGACKLVFDSSVAAHIISGEAVARCLRAHREALAAYERAGAMGFEGADYERARAASQERVQQLESMVRTVEMLERESSISAAFEK